MEEKVSFDPRTGLAQPVVDMLQPNPFVDSLPAPARIKAYNAPWVNSGSYGGYSLDPAKPSTVANFEALANYQPKPDSRVKKLDYQPFGVRYTNFDRYYSHPKFKDLGFSPFRDNETVYNQNSTTLDDMSRMWGQFGRLFGTGFTTVGKSIASTLSGSPLESDYLEAQTFGDAVRIGNSSRGGFGGFANNLILNSGYTLGIIGEMALEELALIGLTAATGGVGGGLAAVRTGTNVGRFLERMKGLSNTLKGVKNAKTFFNAAKNAGVGAAKFINPFENTVNAARAINSAENMSGFAKISTGFGGFYRDVRAAHATISESKLEGAMTELDQREALIRNYQETHNGATPVGEALDKIYESAGKAGFATTMANLPTIYLTNKITFDGMFRGFTPLKGAKGLSLFDSYIGFRKGVAQNAFEVISPSLKNTFKTLKNPRLYGRAALGYTARNLSEGFQETAQEVISGTAKDYYTALYKHPILAGQDSTNYLINQKVNNNVWGQVSTAQGLETFMSGFLMGGVVGPVTRVGQYTAKRFTMSREEIKAQNEAKANDLKEKVNALNEIYNDPLKFFSLNHENLVVQQEASQGMSAAENDNNRKLFQDLKDTSLYHSLFTALESGQFENLIDHMKDLQGMTPEEFKEAFGEETTQIGAEKLQEVVGRAQAFKQTYEAVKEHVGENPFNPSMFKAGTEEYNTEAIKFIAFQDTIKKMVFQRATLERTLERMLSVEDLVKKNSGLQKAGAIEFAPLFDLTSSNNEAKLLGLDIASLEASEELTEDQKKDLAYKKEKLNALNAYRAAVEAFETRLTDLTKKAKGAEVDQLDDETDDVVGQREEEALKKAYFDYLSVISKEDGYNMTQESQDSFNQLVDYFMLRRDRDLMTSSITRAFAPERLDQEVQANFIARLELFANRAEVVSQRLQNLQYTQDQSAYVEALTEAGLIADETEYIRFIKTGELPKKFWDVAGIEVSAEDSPEVKALNAKFKEGNFAQFVKAEKEKAEKQRTENVTAEERNEKKEKEQAALKDVSLSPYSQNVIKAYFTRKYPDGSVDYVDFLASAEGMAIIKYLVAVEEQHAAVKTNEPIYKWMFNAVLSAKSKNFEKVGLIVEDFRVHPDLKPTTFQKQNLVEGQSLTQVKPIKGLYVISENVPATEDSEEMTVYRYADIFGNQYGDFSFETEQEAADNLGDVADTFSAEQGARSFIINGFSFTTGESVHIRLGGGNARNYTVVTEAKEVQAALLNKQKPLLKLRDEETGVVKSVEDVSTVLPGIFNPEARPADRAYLYDLADYLKAYAHVDRESGQTREEAQKELNDLLNGTNAKDIIPNLTFRISANQRVSSEFNIDGKTNPYISKQGEPFNVEVIYNGKVIAQIPQITNLQFKNFDGVVISADQIDFSLFTEIFDVQGNPFENYKRFKLATRASLQLVSNLSKFMEGKTAEELTNAQFQKSVGRITITPGSQDFALSPSEYVPLSSLNNATINGGIYLIDRGISRTEDGGVTYNETVLTTLSAEDKAVADEKVNEAKKKDKAYALSGRYVLAYELPNGDIKFTGLVSPLATEEQKQQVVSLINELQVNTLKQASAGQAIDNSVATSEISDIAYHAHQGGKYSRYTVDEEGNVVIQLDTNPSFNNPLNVVVRVAGSQPVQSIEELFSETNKAIQNAVDQKVKFVGRYIGMSFDSNMFRQNIPMDIDPNRIEDYNLLSTVKQTEVIGKSIAVTPTGFNAAKSAAQTKSSATSKNTSRFAPANKSTATTNKGFAPVSKKASTPAAEETTSETASNLAEMSQQSSTVEAVAKTPYEKAKTVASEIEALEKQRRSLIIKLTNEIKDAEGIKVSEARTKATESEEVKQLDQTIADLKNKYTAKKITENFTEADVEDINAFVGWVTKNLPSFISVRIVDQLKENLKNGSITVGEFTLMLRRLDNGQRLASGAIAVAPNSPYKYHEAFHSVFRLLLSEEDIKKYLGIAKYQVSQALRSKNGYTLRGTSKSYKSLDAALEGLREMDENYANLSKKELEDTLYEEYLADMFDSWKMNPQGSKAVPGEKTLFEIIQNFIRTVVDNISRLINGQPSSKSLVKLFENIDNGKFSTVDAQDNRFTADYIGSVTANKIINTGGKMSVPNPNATSEQNSLIEIDRYLPGDIADRLIASIAATYHERLQLEDFKDRSVDEIFEEVIDDFSEWFNPLREEYVEDPNFPLYEIELEDVYSALTEKSARNDLKEGAKEFLKMLSYAEDIEEQAEDSTRSSTENRKENFEVGGFSSLPTFVRTMIATTTVLDSVDNEKVQLNEYGAPVPYSLINDRPIYRTVDVSKVYTRLLIGLAGVTSQIEALNLMASMLQEESETSAFIASLFEKAGVAVDPNTLEVDVDNITRPELITVVTKAFQNVRLEVDFYGFDTYKKISRIVNSTAQNDINAQLRSWKDNFNALRIANRNFKKDSENVINDLRNYISTGKGNPAAISKRLSEVIGINLSPSYLEYSAAVAAKELDRSNRQATLVSLYGETVKPITVETLSFINKDIQGDDNPFNRSFEEEENDQKDKGSGNRIAEIALNNAIFDERVFAKSRRNAENKEIYSFVSPTYVLKRFKELGIPEIQAALLADAFHKHNFLLKDPRFLQLLAEEVPHLAGDMKAESLIDSSTGAFEVKNSTVNKNTSSKSFKGFNAVEYAFTMLAQYANPQKRVFGKNVYYTVRTNVGVIPESGSNYNFPTPVVKAVQAKNGSFEVTLEALKGYMSILRAEYERIADVHNNRIDGDVYNFNSGKLRGQEFTKSKSFISEEIQDELKNAIIDDKNFEEAAKPLLSKIKASIEKSVQSDIDTMVEWMLENGFLYKDAKGKINASNGLPSIFIKGFELSKGQKDVKKNQAMNIKPGNLMLNLAQFIVNDFITTSPLSTLLQGDAARSFKDFVDEIKRKKAINASGPTAAYDLVAPNLGINKVHENVELVVFEDPLYEATYSRKNGEESEQKEMADAQMYATVKTLRHMLYGFGEIKHVKVARILDAIEKGENLSIDDVFGPHGTIAYNAQTNSLKVVHSYEGKYIKTSMIVLTPRLTSMGENFNEAIPGRELLHNLRVSLETHERENDIISAAVPVSAAKGEKINVASDVNSITSENFTSHPMKGWTLQQVNPSNKLKGTDPSQSKQNIVADLDPNASVIYRGEKTTIGKLIQEYKTLVGERVALKTLAKIASIKKEDGTFDLTKFSEYSREILGMISGDSETAELFKVDENGQLVNDLNNALTIETFEKMIMSFLAANTLKETVPLYSLTLVSNWGMQVVKRLIEVDENGQPKRWEVIRSEEVRANSDKYTKGLFRASDSKARTFTGLTEALATGKPVYYVDDLRHAVPEYNEAGEIVGYFSEVMMPAHHPAVERLLARNPNAKIPDVIAKMFGVRIPTQDKHSNINTRVVDFLDAHYGSVIVGPHELIEISGADFDVDKLFAAYKEWYVKNGQFYEYGESDQIEDMYEDYLMYLSKNDKDVRKAMNLETEETLPGATGLAISSVAYDVEYDQASIVKALKSLGRPATFEEYRTAVEKNGGKDIYEAPYNNKLVDAKMALSWNEDTVMPQKVSTTVPVLDRQQASVRPGVAELFESNPELATIGTPQQYSEYLDSIFPDSEVKDIVYHGTNETFDEFSNEKIGNRDDGFYGKGIYFFKEKNRTDRYGSNKIKALVNILNPFRLSEEEFSKLGNKGFKNIDKSKYDSAYGEYEAFHYSEYYDSLEEAKSILPKDATITEDGYIIVNTSAVEIMVMDSSQTHVLGSKQDIEGFKVFVQQQGSVRPTIDLSREWSGDLESSPVYTKGSVNTMRTKSAKPNEHFGNPWSQGGYAGTIKTSTIAQAVKNYKDWLLGTKFQDVKPEQRTWILDQINQGKLDGANLLYSKKLMGRGKGSHATSLAEVVEQLRVQQQGSVKAKAEAAAVVNQPVSGTLSVTEQPKAFQVAHVDPFRDIMNDDVFAELLKEVQRNPDTFIGKVLAFDDINTGGRLIGYAARAMNSWMVGSELGATLKTPIRLNGQDFYDLSNNLTSDNVRKAYLISAAVSMATDNTKEKLAGPLGFNTDSFSYPLMMLSAGLSLRDALLIMQQPIAKHLFKVLSERNNPFTAAIKQAKNKYSKTGILARFIDGKAKSIENLMIKNQEVLEDVELTTEMLENNLKENDNVINMLVAKLLLQLESQQSAFLNISEVSRLVQGYNQNKFSELDKTDNALENSLVEQEVFEKDPMYGALLKTHRQIKDIIKQLVVTRNEMFSSTVNAVSSGFDVSRNLKSKFDENLPKDLLSFFNLLAYQSYLLRNGKHRFLTTLTNDLVYSTSELSITSIINDLRQKYPDNYFLQKYIINVAADDPKNPHGIAYLEPASFGRLSPIELSRVRNSVMELYMKDPVAVTDLFHYTLVKDGGLYAGGSILNVIPQIVKQDFFDSSKDLLELFNNEDSTEDEQTAVLGMTILEARRLFASSYGKNKQFNSAARSYFKRAVVNKETIAQTKNNVLTINLFRGVRPVEEITTKGLVEVINESTGRVEYLLPGTVLKTARSSEPLNDEEKQALFDNINEAVSSYGFIKEEVDGQTYYTAPYFLLVDKVVYVHTGEALPVDGENGNGTVRPAGFTHSYRPLNDVIGSSRASRIPFALGGKSTPVKKQKEDSTKKENAKKGTGFKKASTGFARVSENNLQDNGIAVKVEAGKKKYYDKATGEEIPEFQGMTTERVENELLEAQEAFESLNEDNYEELYVETPKKSSGFKAADPNVSKLADLRVYLKENRNYSVTVKELQDEFAKYSNGGQNTLEDFIEYKKTC